MPHPLDYQPTSSRTTASTRRLARLLAYPAVACAAVAVAVLAADLLQGRHRGFSNVLRNAQLSASVLAMLSGALSAGFGVGPRRIVAILSAVTGVVVAVLDFVLPRLN